MHKVLGSLGTNDLNISKLDKELVQQRKLNCCYTACIQPNVLTEVWALSQNSKTGQGAVL